MGQYVIATAYSAYSQLDQLALGNTCGHMSWQSFRYEPGSGRLSEEQVDRQTRPELDQLQTYAYDLAGNVVSGLISRPPVLRIRRGRRPSATSTTV